MEEGSTLPEACPPSDTGRGRGPPDTRSRLGGDAGDGGRGRSAERGPRLRGAPAESSGRVLPSSLISFLFKCRWWSIEWDTVGRKGGKMTMRSTKKGRPRAPLLQQLASSRTPLALLAPAPPIVICVIAARSLAPDGPHPLPVSGGGHASQRQLSPVTLHPGAPRAMYFLRLCARATSPNSTLTLALDLSLNRLKPWLYLISPKTASGSMGRILL